MSGNQVRATRSSFLRANSQPKEAKLIDKRSRREQSVPAAVTNPARPLHSGGKPPPGGPGKKVNTIPQVNMSAAKNKLKEKKTDVPKSDDLNIRENHSQNGHLDAGGRALQPGGRAPTQSTDTAPPLGRVNNQPVSSKPAITDPLQKSPPEGTREHSPSMESRINKHLAKIRAETENKSTTGVTNEVIQSLQEQTDDPHRGWQVVGKKKGRPGASPPLHQTPPLSTYNSYSSLSDIEYDDNCDPMNEPSASTADAEKTKQQNAKRRQQRADRSKGTKKTKLPPFFVTGANMRSVIEHVKSELKRDDSFFCKKINKKRLSINVFNIEDYYTLKSSLKEKGIEFDTRTPKQDRIHSILLRGIASEYSEEEVKVALENLKIPDVTITKVEKTNTKRLFKASFSSECFVIQTTSSSKLANLFKIHSILYQAVKWETIKRPDVVQCTWCQRFAHVAKNCGHEFRCVKCPDKHKPGECKVPPLSEITDENSAIKPYCVNCRSYGHPASYRGCPRLAELKARINKNLELINKRRMNKMNKMSGGILKVPNQNNTTQANNARVNSQTNTARSYANAAALGNPRNQNSHQPAQVNPPQPNQNNPLQPNQNIQSYPNLVDCLTPLFDDLKKDVVIHIDNHLQEVKQNTAKNSDMIRKICQHINLNLDGF